MFTPDVACLLCDKQSYKTFDLLLELEFEQFVITICKKMLEILKGKLFSSQQDASEKKIEEQMSNLDLSAGAVLLENYQSTWQALHMVSEDIVKEAERVDKLSKQTKASFDDQWKVITDLNYYFNSLPEISKDLNGISHNIEMLGNSFLELEKSLADLENIIEIQELQKKQNNEKFHLVLHKQKRNEEFNQLKTVLSCGHKLKMDELEKKQSKVLSERQVAFGKAFEDDLQHYVKFGRVEKVGGLRETESELKLEDVNLDQDEVELGLFLQDAEELGENSNAKESE